VARRREYPIASAASSLSGKGEGLNVSNTTYRVVQWATGNVGLHSLRAVIQHPDLQLVGLYVYAESKAGQDAGTLCGIEPIGVMATREIEEILALQPDCVLYMGDRVDVDVLCRLLESGSNVIATRSEFHRPANLDAEVRSRLEDACQRGNTTLHSTGSSPGFITEAMPLVLLSLQRRLDHITINEFADMSSRNSPELIFDLMGFGRDPATFNPQGVEQHGGAAFGGSLELVAEALDLPLDDMVATGQVAVARKGVDIAAGRIEAGTIAAQRMQVSGLRRGHPLLTFSAHWYLTTEVEPAWDLKETGWHLLVEGDVPLDVVIRFPVAPELWAATSPGLTAHRPLNAIPFVCAAASGIRTIVDLPHVIPRLGEG
jgi:4-hydroxy-tetrahydrodipicolinate reductase